MIILFSFFFVVSFIGSAVARWPECKWFLIATCINTLLLIIELFKITATRP